MKILEKQRQDLLIHQWIFSFCRDSNRCNCLLSHIASLWKRPLVVAPSCYCLISHRMNVTSPALTMS
ncbi:unnamed protein product, partial [Musa banksii]